MENKTIIIIIIIITTIIIIITTMYQHHYGDVQSKESKSKKDLCVEELVTTEGKFVVALQMIREVSADASFVVEVRIQWTDDFSELE